MTTPSAVQVDRLAIDTIRTRAIDGVQQAVSGHPGAPIGVAPMAHTLWTRFLRHSPTHPDWSDRDRFVLSAGHASMLLYSLLHLSGYDLPLDELRRFRQWGSRTPGHPESGVTPGAEATTARRKPGRRRGGRLHPGHRSHLLRDGGLYQDLGPTWFDERDRSATVRRTVKRLEALGHRVTLEDAA